MRLIDADALFEFAKTEEGAEILDHSVFKVLLLRKILDNAPTIEAEPVRHRTWVIKTHDDGYGEYQVKHCPDCDAGLPPEFKANYCYWCGAKMDGGEKE